MHYHHVRRSPLAEHVCDSRLKLGLAGPRLGVGMLCIVVLCYIVIDCVVVCCIVPGQAIARGEREEVHEVDGLWCIVVIVLFCRFVLRVACQCVLHYVALCHVQIVMAKHDSLDSNTRTCMCTICLATRHSTEGCRYQRSPSTLLTLLYTQMPSAPSDR
jgi:hypothetical protein